MGKPLKRKSLPGLLKSCSVSGCLKQSCSFLLGDIKEATAPFWAVQTEWVALSDLQGGHCSGVLGLSSFNAGWQSLRRALGTSIPCSVPEFKEDPEGAPHTLAAVGPPPPSLPHDLCLQGEDQTRGCRGRWNAVFA